MDIDIDGARRKLRQAEFFLAQLSGQAEEISRAMRQAREPNREPLEFLVSACLTAAQSAHYVLCKTGKNEFKRIKLLWQSEVGDDGNRHFKRSIRIRDQDIHHAQMAAHVLPKVVAAPFEMQQWFSRGIFEAGLEALPTIENPDGSRVSSPMTVGTLGMYFEFSPGERMEAETVCRRFIDLLWSLTDRAASHAATERSTPRR